VTDQYPQPKLDRLIERLSSLIRQATATIESDPERLDEWYDEIARELRRYHLGAFLSSYGGETPPSKADPLLAQDVKTQLDFLNQFKIEIQGAKEWQAGWNARAEMYAKSIKVPYFRGVTRLLALPAMPAQGTQCLTNCGCFWEVIWIDEENGDADAYWRRGKKDSCQTCVEREVQWSPVQIRGGVLI